MPEIQNESEQNHDLLESENIALLQHNPATTGQRFLNWLIDNLIMRFTLTYATGYAAGYTLAMLFPDFMNRLVADSLNPTLLLLAYVVTIFNYIIYYTLCEKLFRGQTIGKLITGTRAIRTDGSDLTLRNAFLRTLSRLVPFEPFSTFGGRPWHDTWTDTMVIKTR